MDINECVCCREVPESGLSIAPCGHKYCGQCFESGITSFICPASAVEDGVIVGCGYRIYVNELVSLAAADVAIYETIGRNVIQIKRIEEQVVKARKDYENDMEIVEYIYDYLLANIEQFDAAADCLEHINAMYESVKKNLTMDLGDIKHMESALPHFKALCAVPNFPLIRFNIDSDPLQFGPMNDNFGLLNMGKIPWLDKVGIWTHRGYGVFHVANRFKARVVLEDDYNILPIQGGMIYYRDRELIMTNNIGCARKIRYPEPILRVIRNNNIVVTKKLAYNLLDEEMRGTPVPPGLSRSSWDKCFRQSNYSAIDGWEMYAFDNYPVRFREDIIDDDNIIYKTETDSLVIKMVTEEKETTKGVYFQPLIEISMSETKKFIIPYGWMPEADERQIIDCSLANVFDLRDVIFDDVSQVLYISVAPLGEQRGRLIAIEPVA